jgi:hypothetical protein
MQSRGPPERPPIPAECTRASGARTAEDERLQCRVAFQRCSQRNGALVLDAVVCTTHHAVLTAHTRAHRADLNHQPLAPPRPRTREVPRIGDRFPQNARVRAVHIPPRTSVCSVVLPWSAAASAAAPSAWMSLPAPRTTPCPLPALAHAAPSTTTSCSRLATHVRANMTR